MKLAWTRQAKDDLLQITAYIAQDNPTAAEQIAARILRNARLLARFPKIGREDRSSIRESEQSPKHLTCWFTK